MADETTAGDKSKKNTTATGGKTALLVGASGLVGSHCLQQLIDSEHYAKVTVLGRRATGVTHPKLEERVVSFEDPAALEQMAHGDDVFCCLGTTMKKAGSRRAFRRVDHDYVIGVAKAALANGAQHFLLVSSLGANATSSVYYSRVKGETETEARKLGFAVVHILQPSLLLGDRREQRPTERLAMRIAPILAPLLRGPLRKYRAIEARDVARAMVALACSRRASATIESDAIQDIASSAGRL